MLRAEFGVSAAAASLSVSAVIAGIAVANLPFGVLADRHSIRPILLAGAVVVGAASLFCAWTTSFVPLVAARFVQGLFVPALTTCLAAYLSRTLPAGRLDVVMGSYVSATVAGGLFGRLLGGFLHPPAQWRRAFVTAALLLLSAAAAALVWLPRDEPPERRAASPEGFFALLSRPELSRTFAVAFSAFFVFSACFNYLPFYLADRLPVRVITLLYLSYLAGIAAGPLAGRFSTRYGSGATLVGGAALVGCALALTLWRWLPIIPFCLTALCFGFFGMHAAAVGLLNRRLTGSRGRANSMYVLFYYLGGAAGISATGVAWTHGGWPACVALGLAVLAVPLGVGWVELRD